MERSHLMKNGITIESKYGILHGLSSVEVYPEGKLKECSTEEKLVLETTYGKLIPQYKNEEVRRRNMKTLAFYPTGSLKRIALEEQAVVDTGIGPIKAELIHFYENGKIKRVFPLNGKITGYWTEDNEYELATNMKFELDIGTFEKKVINILFYESGKIKSITLWPKELVSIMTSMGKMGIRYGMGLYESGRLKSLEPAYPVMVESSIGNITAFDVNANGINGDINSLNFYEDGRIQSLLTSTDIIVLTNAEGKETIFKPSLCPSLLEEGVDILPLQIKFKDDYIWFGDKGGKWYPITEYRFTVKNNSFQIVNKCGSCASCTGCV